MVPLLSFHQACISGACRFPRVLNGGKFVDKSNNTIQNGLWDKDAKVFLKGGDLTINKGVVVESQEFCVNTYAGGHTVITGGKFTSKDNAVLGTNGNKTTADNTFQIDVSGGDFYGGIQTADYIAFGMYICNYVTVNLTGGTFHITNGSGIALRSGTLNISEKVVFDITDGDRTRGWVGDKSIALPSGHDIVQDNTNPMYPAGPSTLNVVSGSFDIIDYKVTGITVTTGPTKTTYVVGETFDPSGMTVGMTYSDGTTVPVEGYTYTTEPLTAGTGTVTITYNGMNADVNITVNAA